MKNALLVLNMMLMLFGSSSSTFASTEAERRDQESVAQEQEEEDVKTLPGVLTRVLGTFPDPETIGARMLWWHEKYGDGLSFPPEYLQGEIQFMESVYEWVFQFEDGIDYVAVVDFMWETVGGREEERTREFAEAEGVNAGHAWMLWSWRQEFLRQARRVMDDPKSVCRLYEKHRKTLVGLMRQNKNDSLQLLDMILGMIQGTHELSAYLTVVLYAREDLRDDVYAEMRDIPRIRQAARWAFWLERRRAVGGDQLIQVYRKILVDLTQAVASSN